MIKIIILTLMISAPLQAQTFTVLFYGSENSTVAPGLERLTTEATGTILVRFNEMNFTTVQIELDTPQAEHYSVFFVGASDTLPDPGLYRDIRKRPSNGAFPGMDFSGEGNSCTTVGGWFDVLELEIDPMIFTITKFSANFEQQCDDDPAEWVCGQIRYNSDIPIQPYDQFDSGFEEPDNPCGFYDFGRQFFDL